MWRWLFSVVRELRDNFKPRCSLSSSDTRVYTGRRSWRSICLIEFDVKNVLRFRLVIWFYTFFHFSSPIPTHDECLKSNFDFWSVCEQLLAIGRCHGCHLAAEEKPTADQSISCQKGSRRRNVSPFVELTVQQRVQHSSSFSKYYMCKVRGDESRWRRRFVQMRRSSKKEIKPKAAKRVRCRSSSKCWNVVGDKRRQSECLFWGRKHASVLEKSCSDVKKTVPILHRILEKRRSSVTLILSAGEFLFSFVFFLFFFLILWRTRIESFVRPHSHDLHEQWTET